MAALSSLNTISTIDGKYGEAFNDLDWKTDSTYDQDVKEPTIDPGIDFLNDISMTPVEPPTVEDVFDDAKTLRENKLHALMLRLETVDIVESIERSSSKEPNIMEFLLRSREHLHTFAQLVEQDLISLENGNLVLTALCYQLMDVVPDL